jgi:hypothetical protein
MAKNRSAGILFDFVADDDGHDGLAVSDEDSGAQLAKLLTGEKMPFRPAQIWSQYAGPGV